jgi:hypothetical protein
MTNIVKWDFGAKPKGGGPQKPRPPANLPSRFVAQPSRSASVSPHFSPASHCDNAWAGTLATNANAQAIAAGPMFIFEDIRRSQIIARCQDWSLAG